MKQPFSSLSRNELIELYKHYDTALKDELDFCHRYLNFYIGLLSTILALTMTGLVDVSRGDAFGLALVVGPLLAVVLACIGYSNFQIFYRRFTEAWVTKANIEGLLDYSAAVTIEQVSAKAPYPSKYGGFITQIDWPPIRDVFNQATQEERDAEWLAGKLARIGSTSRNARWTFLAFAAVSLLLSLAVIVRVYLFQS